LLSPWVELPPPPEDLWRIGSARQIGASAELREQLRRLDDAPSLAATAQLGQTLLPVVDHIAPQRGSPTDQELPPAAQEWLARLKSAGETAAERATHRISELCQLAARCTELADIEYGFLYDEDRQLLAIGYNVGEHRRDGSFYDLLASEARLASFVAIAQ